MDLLKIEKPVFIIGVARSGTTVFYNMFATHPDVTWFSNYSNFFRTFPQTAVLHRLIDMPGIGELIKQNIIFQKGSKLTIRPNEGEEIYHEMCGVPFNTDMAEEKDFPEQAAKLRQAIAAHLKYTGKKTFISKQTANNRRLHLLNSIFPDARFVHIVRDGRAVARSLVKEKWWRDIGIWWLNKTAGEMDTDPIPLFLEYWKRVHDEIVQVAPMLGNRYIEFRYEDLSLDVQGTIRCLADFLEWKTDERFIARLPKSLPNMNFKWQNEFTTIQKKQAVKLIGRKLHKIGYNLE